MNKFANKENTTKTENESKIFPLIIIGTVILVVYKLCKLDEEEKENQIKSREIVIKEKDKLIGQLISIISEKNDR